MSRGVSAFRLAMVEDGFVRFQHEDETDEIDDDEHRARRKAQLFKKWILLAKIAEDREVEDGRHDERHHGDEQHRAVGGCRRAGERLLFPFEPAGQDAQSQYEQQVPDDAAR